MKNLIIGNWKSHKSLAETQTWLEEFLRDGISEKLLTTEAVLAPSFPLVAAVSHFLQQAHSLTTVAVQDLSPFPPGSYTGAITTENLLGLGVKYAIVGHSERRRYFHETHMEVANKVDQALQAGITPVVCVDDEYVQLQAAALSTEQRDKCIVAYEPLEAIGNGHNQPIEEIVPVVKNIQQAFGEVKTLYGGSVSASNVQEYLSVTQGALVGTHSLLVADFLHILTACD